MLSKIAKYFKIQSKRASMLNLLGLIIGLAAFVYINVYVNKEFSFDKFHERADRIYRCCTDLKFNGDESLMADSNGPIADAIMSGLPEAESVTQCFFGNNYSVSHNNTSYIEEAILFADSNFLSFFTYELVSGDVNSVLSKNNSVVLTESAAKKYFGNESPLGKTLMVSDKKLNCEVTGVMKDVPENSHLQFSMLFNKEVYMPYRYPSWGNWSGTYTYLTLKPNVNLSEFEAKFAQFPRKYYSEMFQAAMGINIDQFEDAGNHLNIVLQPLSDIHLNIDFDNDAGESTSPKLLYILQSISIFILILACINFTNISIASASKRAKEIGVKKASGASRYVLVKQLLSETFVQCVISVILSLVILFAILPFINNLTGLSIKFIDFNTTGIIITLLALPIIVSLASGSYPAIKLTGQNTSEVMRSGSLAVKSRSRLRSVLVCFQFIVFVVLAASTLLINKQVNYVSNLETGYSKDNLLIVDNSDQLGASIDVFKNKLQQLSSVKTVSCNDFFTGGGNPFGNVDSDESILMERMNADNDMIATMGIELVEGRFFSGSLESESNNLVINESAAKYFGYNNIIGKQIKDYNRNGNYTVIGVVKDFQRWSFRVKPEPLVFYPNNGGLNLIVRLHGSDISSALSEIENEWHELNSGMPFSYTFLDDSLNRYYEKDKQLIKLLTGSSVLAMLLACFGLIGLVAFSAKARQKEIGVRKVNGAKIYSVMAMLSEDYLKWIGIAFIIACPIGYYIMNKWLEDFAYKTELSWWIFALAGLSAMLIALFTVSFQSYKAATRNPVEALKYE